ncbi:GNAT family N-acetyltransferase [Nisaea acidiphila]|uniref:GNAT family N-acetyltransferase n=1 Tax=Nisaea acidiphila TaxID=1862145 RepID=A0A9J7ATA1_9PROT|nr:GNAT family N-acetyltransferase [Nisaea acidiphila]UUX50398.1 GNAT family N-acetyltransferase [Nisaea acidiphila]
MSNAGSVRVVPVAERHKQDWRRLYDGYAAFYKVPMTDEIAGAVWGWLHDPAHVMNCLIAEDEDGKAIGLAHIRAMPRPLSGAECGFLDDLFVDPDARGKGVFEALFAAMDEMAQKNGWAMVRWLTQEFNYRGRSAYDRIATKTPFILYQRDTPAG